MPETDYQSVPGSHLHVSPLWPMGMLEASHKGFTCLPTVHTLLLPSALTYTLISPHTPVFAQKPSRSQPHTHSAHIYSYLLMKWMHYAETPRRHRSPSTAVNNRSHASPAVPSSRLRSWGVAPPAQGQPHIATHSDTCADKWPHKHWHIRKMLCRLLNPDGVTKISPLPLSSQASCI